MSRRSKSREVALQMLYQQDLNPDMDYHTVRDLIRAQLHDEELYEFAWFLFVGVMEHRTEIDARIEAIAQNWSLKRMAPTDRNVLRIGAFEMLHMRTPARVVIDEALELAKRFGSAQSSQFVNGILDRLIPDKARLPAESPPLPAAEPPPTPASPSELPPDAIRESDSAPEDEDDDDL